MLSSFYLILVLGLLALAINRIRSVYKTSQHRREGAKRGCQSPPMVSKKGLFGLGRLLEASKANKEGRSPQWFVERFDELGEDVHTLRVSALDYELIATRDPENAKNIFHTNSNVFEISPFRRDIWGPLLGNGIFTATGEEWKHSRQLLRPQFSRDQISDLAMEERHVQSMMNLEILKTSSQDGWTQDVDLAPLFLNFTMDVATDFLYGRSVNSQSQQTLKFGLDQCNKDGIGSDFSYHLDAAKSWLYTKSLFGRWNQLIHSPSLTKHCKVVHQFVDDLVTQRLNSDNKLESDSNRFFLLNELAKATQDPLELRNETLQLLNAGRDTTGALLGWVFYFLARNDRVFDKLRTIILAEFGTDRKSSVDFQTLKRCAYLNNTIQEVLRVAAVVPYNERVATEDTTLPRGGGMDGTEPVFVYKGQRVLIANYAMQHRADIWGGDVHDFKPERWEEKKPGYDFLPFGAGRRKCIGQQFALTETAYVIVRFLQRFDKIENLEASGPPFFQYVISNRSGTGVQVRLHEAL